MSQKSIILAAVIFALLIVGMFIYANLKQTELNTKETILPSENTEPVLYPEITRIDAKHYFIDDVHTLVGEIKLPQRPVIFYRLAHLCLSHCRNKSS